MQKLFILFSKIPHDKLLHYIFGLWIFGIVFFITQFFISYWTAILCGLAVSILVEAWKELIFDKKGEWWDFIATILGSITGLLLILI